MPYTDKSITCRDCGADFLFTAGEQAFYQEKGFQHPPSRCPSCRSQKRQSQGGGSSRQTTMRASGGPGGETGGGGRAGDQSRAKYPAVCDQCGKETTVPFQPRGDRPVYCRDCYQAMRR